MLNAPTNKRQVDAVTAAVAKLLVKLGPAGFTPEAIFEGAVKGAAVQLIASRNLSTIDVADLLADVAEAFRDGTEEGADDARPN